MHGLKLFCSGLRLLVFLAASGGPLLAQGGPPFQTDDPGTPGDGRWEINLAWTQEQSAGARQAELPLLDLNYGIGERLQLKYEIARVVRSETAAGQASGAGNSLVGVKWRFYDDQETGWAFSIYPQFEFRNPASSSVRHGLVSDENVLILPTSFQKRWGSWSMVGEIGSELPSKSSAGWFYGFVVDYMMNDRMDLGVELRGAASRGLERTRLAAAWGMRYACNERLSLLVSWGRDIHNRFDAKAAATTRSYFAIQFRL